MAINRRRRSASPTFRTLDTGPGMTPSHAVGENSTIAGDAAKETNHRSPRPRSAARAMAGLLARGSTTDADLPGFPVIIGGVVLPLTVAGAATASAFRPAPCSLLIPEGNHQRRGYRGRTRDANAPARRLARRR